MYLHVVTTALSLSCVRHLSELQRNVKSMIFIDLICWSQKPRNNDAESGRVSLKDGYDVSQERSGARMADALAKRQ